MSETLTLTARKKAREAEKAAKSLPPVPAPRESILARYEPAPLANAAAISWDGDAFLLETTPGHIVRIPATERGLAILEGNLRARRAALQTNAQPRLGSDTHPTQHQIENFLRLRTEREMLVRRAGAVDAAKAAQDTSLGF